MKRMKGLVIVGAVLAVLGAGAVGFWSLGAVASEAVPQIRVEVVEGSVEIRSSGADWQPINVTREIRMGDEVRTGTDGKASIRWGDRGETRLDPDTTLIVEEAPADASQVTKVAVRLKLQSGRAWSRVLKLLDVDSGFEVRTDAVVATVRGTAFGAAATPGGAELAVTESVVAANPASGDPATLLKDNQWGSFSPTGTPIIVRDLLPTDAWANENRALDQKFDEALRQELLQRFKDRESAVPLWLSDLSERLHVSLASADEKPDLIANYLGRRIALVLQNPNAAAELFDVDPSWLELTGAPRERVIGDLRAARFLGLARPDLAFGKFDGFGKLVHGFLGKTPTASAYLEALDIDDAIDLFLTQPANPANEREALLGRIDAWEAALPTDVSADDSAALHRKAEALRRRLDVPVSNVVLTSDEMEAPTSTDSVEPTAAPSSSPKPSTGTTTPTPAPTPTNQPCTHTSFTVYAKPSTVMVGESVSLSMFGSCSNGTTETLTSSASFATGSSSDGSISGNTFTPSRAGTVTISGTVYENGTPKTAKATVTVRAQTDGAKLDRVDATTPGSTALTTGQSVPLQARAYYIDGTSMDVTYQCAWSSSDSRLAYISGQRLYAGTGEGSATASCSYTEAGKTVTDGIVFTVKLDPSLYQGGSGAPKGGVTGKLF